jgi:tetratricopeptide (TPR) repeat protein
MPEPTLDAIRKLKQKGTAYRNLGNFERALNTFEQAIADLKALLESGHLDAREARELRAELADTYGMEGGTFRRWLDRSDHLDRALEQYRKGLEIERVEKKSTYNASNVITLSITQDQRPLDAGLREDLNRVIQQLEEATAGPRADEFWAWADLAQFYLLRGDLDKARSSYNEALQRGPTAQESRRHLEILRGLVEAIRPSAPALAERIGAVVKEWEQSQTR